MHTTCPLMSISKQFFSLSNVFKHLMKYRPRSMIQEADENQVKLQHAKDLQYSICCFLKNKGQLASFVCLAFCLSNVAAIFILQKNKKIKNVCKYIPPRAVLSNIFLELQVLLVICKLFLIKMFRFAVAHHHLWKSLS